MSPPPTPVDVRRILGLARTEAGSLSVGILALFVGSAMSLAYPQAIRLIVDEALGSHSQLRIDRAALILTGVFAVQAAARGLQQYIFSAAGERVLLRLREKVFANIVAQEVAFFDRTRTGELISRLGSDTSALHHAVSSNIAMALSSAAQALGGIVMLVYTSPSLTLLMLCVVPPALLTGLLSGRSVRTISRKIQDALAESNGVAEEVFTGIRTVRSFAAERHETGRYRDTVRNISDLAHRRARIASFSMAITSFVGFCAASVVLWYGSRLMARGDLTVGGLTSFLVYTMLVSVSVNGMMDLYSELMRASGSAERVFAMLDRQPAIPTSGGARIADLRGHIQFDAVRFAYPERLDVHVLQGIDLTLQPGEVVALVGPSGAGKSTLAALLARLYDPQEGRLLLDGQELRGLDPEWLRQQIGTVAQEPQLFSGSILDNIRYGRLGATAAEVEAAARAANAHEFIIRFPDGYHTQVGERGVQLSGGQKQRIAIARAVLKDPRILVLDEATSALDAESEHLVQGALEHLMKGRTTLIIAHRLSTVLGADRVLVLEGGQVVQSGDHESLMAQDGLYRRLVERQFVAA